MDAHHLFNLTPNPKIEAFGPGDTVRVSVKVTEGDRTRTQAFEGVVIRRRGHAAGSTFTVRRAVADTAIERTFLFHSPVVEGVKVMRRGDVRRSKLFYLRGRSGKNARIKEKRTPVQAVKPKAQAAKAPVVAAEPAKPAGKVPVEAAKPKA